jgi:hypothetical protein
MTVARNGRNFSHILTTFKFLSNATTSIEKRMPNVWMPDEGLMRSPHPASNVFLPIKPIRRDKKESATVIRLPTMLAFVVFQSIIVLLTLATSALKASQGYLG